MDAEANVVKDTSNPQEAQEPIEVDPYALVEEFKPSGPAWRGNIDLN